MLGVLVGKPFQFLWIGSVLIRIHRLFSVLCNVKPNDNSAIYSQGIDVSVGNRKRGDIAAGCLWLPTQVPFDRFLLLYVTYCKTPKIIVLIIVFLGKNMQVKGFCSCNTNWFIPNVLMALCHFININNCIHLFIFPKLVRIFFLNYFI